MGLISVEQAAVLLGCASKTIRRRIADGSLPAHRVGPRVIRVRYEDVLALMRPLPTARADELEFADPPDDAWGEEVAMLSRLVAHPGRWVRVAHGVPAGVANGWRSAARHVGANGDFTIRQAITDSALSLCDIYARYDEDALV